MRDGYYLSTYLHIGELAHLKNIFFRHDHNISFWEKKGEDIELIHYWELERLTGLKEHEKSFFNIDHAKVFINKLLEEYGITLGDIIEIWGTPMLQTCNDYHSINDIPGLEYHSIAHLFSALLVNTDIFYKETIIGLAVDGGPDKVLDLNSSRKYYCGCVTRKGKIIDIFPVSSPGYIWGRASEYFNLKEGTLMALASACKSELYYHDQKLMTINDLNTTRHSTDVKEYLSRLIETVSNLTEKDEGILFSGFDRRFSTRENIISMVMKEIQKTSYNILACELDRIIEKYRVNPKESYLALSGGYALNCPTNSKLVTEYEFKGFMAPPCVNDSGLSLGIALYAFYKKNKKINFNLQHAYYGDKFENLHETIIKNNYSAFIKLITPFDINKAISDIEEYPIVWFNGAAEIGPRALGNRSIIADPRNISSKDILNQIKQRQWWRPVAPVVLEEEIHEWFENAYKSPFMLHTFQIRNDKSGLIPAIAHLDNSSRVQTVSFKDNPMLYKLITGFSVKTGIPILCNTSLNDKSEPIINTINEALNFVLRKDIKVAYINGFRLEICNHREYHMDKPEPRPYQSLKYSYDEDMEALQKKYNPFDIPSNILSTYYSTQELYTNFDIIQEKDVKALLKIANYINKRQVQYEEIKNL